MHMIMKYPLQTDVDEFVLKVPAGAQLLHVESVSDSPYLWVEGNPAQDVVERVIACRGTGKELPDGHRTYVGSAVMMNGRLVAHYYDMGER